MWDPVEHTGSLFWIVHRSLDHDEANMVIDQVLWEHKVTLSMPFKKAKHHVQWQQQDLPTIPVLMNPKAIKKQQPLVVLGGPSTMSMSTTNNVCHDTKK